MFLPKNRFIVLKTLFLVTGIGFISIYLLSCASQNTSNSSTASSDNTSNSALPSVFLNPNETYNNRLYIASVGSGDTLEQARQSALSALVQQIEVDVSSTFEASEKYTQENSTSIANISTRIFDASKNSSEATLKAVEYGENYQDSLGRFYTIAFINRQKVGNIYQDTINKNEKIIERTLEEAKSNKTLIQYAKYLSTLHLAQENKTLIEQLTVISPISDRFDTAQSPSHIRDLLRSSAQSLQFSIDTKVTSQMTTQSNEINSKISRAVSELLNSLYFQIVKNKANYTASAVVDWSEETKSYPTVFWNITFQIIELTDTPLTLISKNQQGRSRGIDMKSARRFAIIDITKLLNTLFVEYIKTQLL